MSSQYGTRSLRRKKEPRAEVRTAALVFLFRLYSSNPLQLQVMLGVLPGAARFYSRPSDRCGTFKGPSFPLPRPRLFFFFSPVWCWGARQGPEVRSSQHNASKTCRDTHFFLSLLFVGCSPSVWPLVVLLFVCPPLNYISRIRLCRVQSREPRILRCLFFFFIYVYAFRFPLRFVHAVCPLFPFPSLWVTAASIA